METFYEVSFAELEDGTIRLEQPDGPHEPSSVLLHPEQLKLITRQLCGLNLDNAASVSDLERKIAILADDIGAIAGNAFYRRLLTDDPDGEPLLIKLDALHDLAAEFDGGRLLPKSHAEGLQRENSVAHDAGFEPSIHHAAKRTPEARTGQPTNKQLPLMG